jgi:hypothetical protein
MNRRLLPAAVLLLALPLGCSGEAVGSPAPTARPATTAPKGPAMTKQDCGPGNVARTSCMIRLILDDIEASYSEVGGGGIGEIRQLGSTRFRVEILQEERADVLTYAFDVADDGAVSISGKEASTESKGPPS